MVGNAKLPGVSGFCSRVHWHFWRLVRTVCLGLFRYVVAHPMEVGPQSVLIFSPHQDDETLGCGGLIALKRRGGASVHIAFLTDGSRGCGEASLYSPEHLVETRRCEAIAALDVLDVEASHLTFLNAPDGALASLDTAQKLELLHSLEDLLCEVKPDQVLLPFRQDNHPDHRATYRLVQEALKRSKATPQLFFYPIWALEAPWRASLRWSEFRGARYLRVGDVLERKRAALREYRSQVEPQPPNGRLGLSPGFLQLFLKDYELYLVDDKTRESAR